MEAGKKFIQVICADGNFDWIGISDTREEAAEAAKEWVAAHPNEGVVLIVEAEEIGGKLP